jgi:ubiquitin C-terminal hydrolase
MVKHALTIVQPGTIAKPAASKLDRAGCEDDVGEKRYDAFGLVNNGASCWFNSLVQALISVPEFIEIVSDVSYLMQDGSLLAEFGKFLRAAGMRPIENVSPILRVLSDSVGNFGRRQEDAHEGFHLLLDKMGSPMVEKIFESLWRVDLYCDSCKALVSRPDDFEKMIQVIMERDFILVEPDGDAFERFLSGHMTFLEGYKCPKCETVGKAMRIARLVKPPCVLVISFNKYMGKWMNPAYGLHIDVKYMPRPKVTEVAGYELRAVIRHYGSMYGGHYNATGMRAAEPIGFDDAVVDMSSGWKPVVEDYMLFYARR